MIKLVTNLACVRIRNYLKEHGIKQKFIVQKSQIKSSTLSSKLNGKSKLTADDIEIICGILGCSPADFLKPREPVKEAKEA